MSCKGGPAFSPADFQQGAKKLAHAEAADTKAEDIKRENDNNVIETATAALSK